MVQLEEIKDEDDHQIQPGPEDDEDFTDTGLLPARSSSSSSITTFLIYHAL